MHKKSWLTKKKNVLRELIKEGKPTIGTHVHSVWPGVAEVIGHSGTIDYVEFVATYAPYNLFSLEDFGRAIDLFEHMSSMMKLDQEQKIFQAERAFGSGIQNLLFSHIRTVEDAKEAVAGMRAETPGSGGLAGASSTRDMGYVFPDVELQDFVKATQDGVVALMIEKKSAVDNLEEILSVPGIDMVQFGGGDYSMNIGAFGNYHQFIETIQDDFNPPLLDNWLAVDESVDPASAQQYILGYEEYFQDTYKLQIEGYYKDIQNMLTYEEFRSSTDADVSDENVRDTFTPSDGYAYGLELFGQKMVGKLTGWIGYTYSVSRKIMDSQYSDGTEEYYTNWDRAHALSILGSYVKNDKWDINFKWSWQSGQAYTPILGYYLEKTPGDPNTTFHTIPGVRNSGRYPAYHRLDLGAVRHGTIFNKKAEFFIQLINTYNRKNIFRYVYRLGNVYNGIDDDGDWVEKDHDANDNGVPDVGEVNVDEEDEGRMQRRDISLFPVIPTIGITIYF